MYRKQTGVFSRLALLFSLSLTYSSTFTSFSSPQTSPFIFLPFSFLLPLLNLPSSSHFTSSLFSSFSFTSSSNFSVQLPPLFLPPPSPLPSLLHLLLFSLLPYLLPPPRPQCVPSTLRTTMLSPHLQHIKTFSSVHVASPSNNGTSRNTV